MWLELEGRTPDEIGAGIDATAERLTGRAAGPGALGPVDGDAASGQGADDAEARTDVEALYESTGLLLGMLCESAGLTTVRPGLHLPAFNAEACAATHPPVGLAPPTRAHPLGHWYVRAPDGATNRGVPAPLHGRWSDDGSTTAVLPLTDIASIEDGDDQHACIAAFVASAWNACLEMTDARS